MSNSEAAPALAEPNVTGPRPEATTALRDFCLALAVLLILRFVTMWVAIPMGMLTVANLLISVLFIAVPVAGLFRGASHRWTWGQAAGAIALGTALQFGLMPFLPGIANPTARGILLAISQSGLPIWCLGLGAALSLVLRDRNLLVPMSIFLALFDIWLVFVPEGPVGQVARGNQTALASVAFSVPRPMSAPTGAPPTPLAYIGPADFLFMAMFFCAIYRFNLRARETAKWMAPVLACYLLVALLLPGVAIGPIRLGALPALVPIATVVMLVNWREFKLTRDEKQTTVVLAILGIALLTWRFMVAGETRPIERETESPPATSPRPVGPAAPR